MEHTLKTIGLRLMITGKEKGYFGSLGRFNGSHLASFTGDAIESTGHGITTQTNKRFNTGFDRIKIVL